MTEKLKNYGNSILYGKIDEEYRRKNFEYIMKADRIDKNDPAFDTIKYEIRRQQSTACLSRLIDSDAIVFTNPKVGTSKAFRVCAFKDVREDGRTRIFIDLSDLIKLDKGGQYTIKYTDIDTLIAYMSCALNEYIIYTRPENLVRNTALIASSTECFAKLVANVIDYMRIGSVDNVRAKTMYLASMYYQLSILNRQEAPSIYQRALKLSGLSSKEAEILQIKVQLAAYENIETFIHALAEVLNISEQLSLNEFINKWVFLYGSGTQYATEVYSAFANMLIHAYVGDYFVNQKQIEKILGRKMVEFVSTIFSIGGEVL